MIAGRRQNFRDRGVVNMRVSLRTYRWREDVEPLVVIGVMPVGERP